MENMQTNLILMAKTFLFRKNYIEKLKKISPLMYLVLKIKSHTKFILISIFKNLHYVLIKDFNRFMAYKAKHYGKNQFDQY